MEILIIIFIIIAVISNSSKKEAEKNKRQTRTSTGEEPWQKAARENIEKAAKRATAAANRALGEMMTEGTQQTLNFDEKKERESATSQIHQRRIENRNTTILERAKSHAEEKKEDVTLNTMEEEHNHSERVSAAVHHHPEDVMPESMLGSVEDLMVKGYDGTLCFERDFVGEAMDMINRFTVPSDIPGYSSEEVL